MKAFKYFAFIAVFGLLMLTSCDKESDLSDDLSTATIRVKSNGVENSLDFEKSYIIKNCDEDSGYSGASYLYASTFSKTVLDIYALYFAFDQIDNVKVGAEIKPKDFFFSFLSSSASGNITYEYDGKITLKGKSNKYAIIHFENVFLSVEFGDYVINGDLKCPLLEKEPWEE